MHSTRIYLKLIVNVTHTRKLIFPLEYYCSPCETKKTNLLVSLAKMSVGDIRRKAVNCTLCNYLLRQCLLQTGYKRVHRINIKITAYKLFLQYLGQFHTSSLIFKERLISERCRKIVIHFPQALSRKMRRVVGFITPNTHTYYHSWCSHRSLIHVHSFHTRMNFMKVLYLFWLSNQPKRHWFAISLKNMIKMCKSC